MKRERAFSMDNFGDCHYVYVRSYGHQGFSLKRPSLRHVQCYALCFRNILKVRDCLFILFVKYLIRPAFVGTVLGYCNDSAPRAMARRKEQEELEEPVTNLKGHPIHFDENTTENWMRRVSVRDMMELAKRPDPEGDACCFTRS